MSLSVACLKFGISGNCVFFDHARTPTVSGVNIISKATPIQWQWLVPDRKRGQIVDFDGHHHTAGKLGSGTNQVFARQTGTSDRLKPVRDRCTAWEDSQRLCQGILLLDGSI